AGGGGGGMRERGAWVRRGGRDEPATPFFSFFVSNQKFPRRNWKLAREAGSAIVDMSYALENEPNVPVSAPWVEREIGKPMQFTLESSAIVTADPAAVVLALLLLRSGKAGPVRTVAASVFEPVSEQGRAGMDELHEQTVNLLSFQQMPTGVFGSQVAFNMLDRYGKASPQTLEATERRVNDHLRRLLGPDAQLPAIAVLQAPVFHA